MAVICFRPAMLLKNIAIFAVEGVPHSLKSTVVGEIGTFPQEIGGRRLFAMRADPGDTTMKDCNDLIQNIFEFPKQDGLLLLNHWARKKIQSVVKYVNDKMADGDILVMEMSTYYLHQVIIGSY